MMAELVAGALDLSDLDLDQKHELTLQVAWQEGYFRKPSGCGLEDLADALDISIASASRYLRAALYEVLAERADDPPPFVPGGGHR